MQTWARTSPYQWVGYYIQSPCHRGGSWMGRRAEIEGMGLGIAALYVGQQTWDGVAEPEEQPAQIICSRTLLTRAEGQRSGRDAVQKMASEGFPTGSTIFLNVERMERVSPEMVEYYRAWIETVIADGRFVAGTYVHRLNAETLFTHAKQVHRAAGIQEAPPFWVAGGAGFTLNATPREVGFAFATIWQGALDVNRTWGDIQLLIDENVSTRRNPSAPRASVAQTGG